MVRGGIFAVGAEVTQTHELEPVGGLGVSQGGFHLAVRQNLQGMGVQALQKILIARVGFGVGTPLTLRPSAGSPPRLSGS